MSFVDWKISKHVWHGCEIWFSAYIISSYVMFFSYANFPRSPKRHCYELHLDTLFQECFWSRSINSQVVFYRGIKQLSFASSSWLYTPIKPSRSFIERYKKDHKFRPLSGFVYCFRSFVNANIYKSKKKLSVICFNKREWSKRGNRPYMTLFP